jgi:ADP-ribose pyrophosphatase
LQLFSYFLFFLPFPTQHNIYKTQEENYILLQYDVIQSNIIFKNPWIQLYQDKIETRNGKTIDYTWYKASDVVVIVPFLDSSTLIMIRQYRYPLRKVLLEFPAGHIENGEDVKEAAKRELLEETGYLAKELRYLYTYHPSVSKSRQLVHIFKGEGLIENESKHDSTEDIISVDTVSIIELKDMITKRKIESAGTLLAYLICCTGIYQ